jgi:FAD/FMN-containing dehydrogenase
MERMNRILEIDEVNLLAVVEPNVITGDLQRAVEAVGCSIRRTRRASTCRRSAAT